MSEEGKDGSPLVGLLSKASRIENPSNQIQTIKLFPSNSIFSCILFKILLMQKKKPTLCTKCCGVAVKLLPGLNPSPEIHYAEVFEDFIPVSPSQCCDNLKVCTDHFILFNLSFKIILHLEAV
jgi:hypothetical protein